MAKVTSNYPDDTEFPILQAAAAAQGKTPQRFQRDATNLVAGWVTAPPPPPPPPPPSPMPPALAGTNWKLAWEDQFLGSAVDLAKWGVMHNSDFGTGNDELQTYMASQVRVADGRVTLKADWDPATNRIISGMLSQRRQDVGVQKQAFWPGCYIEVLCRWDVDRPAWPSLWLVGADGAPGWPMYGEIDLFEGYGDGRIESNYHWSTNGATSGHVHLGGSKGLSGYAGEWVKLAAWWESDRLRFIYKDLLIRDSVTEPKWDAKATEALKHPHCMRLNLAYGGVGPRYHGFVDGTERQFVPTEFQVDHIRVWQHA